MWKTRAINDDRGREPLVAHEDRDIQNTALGTPAETADPPSR
jgi:hypothetical protein